LLGAFAGHPVRVLGDGANLLVADEGIDGLVVSLERLEPESAEVEHGDGSVTLVRGAGLSLPRLVTDTVREGLAGLEGLAGVPASLGGAVMMNAGGAFGQIGDAVAFVRALRATGEPVSLARGEIEFGYRRSGLAGLIVTSVGLRLRRVAEGERAALRERLKEVMASKKASQPMGADSAGCFFKNPTIDGSRVSAGMLIDRAGCKGMRVGGAEVSAVHANFIVTHADCTATDILMLAERVRERVRTAHGVSLENEVVVWRRGP
ncbi:MAG TPA: UDP-N-acetylenolpyruvoylglucosamine reductase, partial [Phycisphaerales bacterium]|nr:UDP-N-acetylenolpyruvoylglucosamine reductase [Phycisphaerales bacterium]